MGSIRRINRIKKGQDFTAFLFVLVILFAVSIVLIVLNKTWSEIKTPLNTGIQSAIPSNTNLNITKTLDKVSSAGIFFDKLIPFLIIGLFAFVLIIAGSFMQHPIMIFVGIIIMGVAIMLAVIYSNIYNNITETDEFSAQKAEMGITDKFMKNLPVIIFIMAIGIAASIIWSRRGGGGL